MIPTETVLLTLIIVVAIFNYILWLYINKIEEKVERLIVWAEELEEWIEQGGDAYMGLNFDVDLAKEEIKEEILNSMNKESKGDK